jgi:hypothetical protein
MCGEALACAQSRQYYLPALAEVYDHLGQLAYIQSDLRGAAQSFTRALHCLLLAAPDPLQIRHLLGEMAVVGVAEGSYARAARLLSHVPERYPPTSCLALLQLDLLGAEIAGARAACRTALGEQGFAAAQKAGLRMTLEEVAAEALKR